MHFLNDAVSFISLQFRQSSTKPGCTATIKLISMFYFFLDLIDKKPKLSEGLIFAPFSFLFLLDYLVQRFLFN